MSHAAPGAGLQPQLGQGHADHPLPCAVRGPLETGMFGSGEPGCQRAVSPEAFGPQEMAAKPSLPFPNTRWGGLLSALAEVCLALWEQWASKGCLLGVFQKINQKSSSSKKKIACIIHGLHYS